MKKIVNKIALILATSVFLSVLMSCVNNAGNTGSVDNGTEENSRVFSNWYVRYKTGEEDKIGTVSDTFTYIYYQFNGIPVLGGTFTEQSLSLDETYKRDYEIEGYELKKIALKNAPVWAPKLEFKEGWWCFNNPGQKTYCLFDANQNCIRAGYDELENVSECILIFLDRVYLSYSDNIEYSYLENQPDLIWLK